MDALPFCKVTLRGVRCLHGPYFTKKKGYPATPKTIGEAIRKRRLDLGLTQTEVAKLIGCNEMTIVNWEKGHTAPRVNHMAAVVAFLEYTPLPAGDGIAARLIAFRKERGMTQKEFARALEIDPSTLAKWERGEREPKGVFLDRVVRMIGARETTRFETGCRPEVPSCIHLLSIFPGKGSAMVSRT